MSPERTPEQPNPSEFFPTPGLVEVLRGEISEPLTTLSRKPGPTFGQEVEVRIVKDGVGLWGLTDWKDNKEWSGIQNHMWKTGRFAVHIAQEMRYLGVLDVNPQRILDAMLVSHVGRRQWDEARWYPDIAEYAEEKQKVSNEMMGLRLLHGRVDDDVFSLVAGLAHELDDEEFSVDPEIYESWDYKLTIYVDHRTSDKYEPLNTRMGDFLLNFFFDKDKVTGELRDSVYTSIQDIIKRRKRDQIDLDEADMIAQKLGASETSPRLSRRELMRLILQDADTEKELEWLGIDPDAIDDETVPMPAWEDTIRRQYVEAAAESIVDRLKLHYESLWGPRGDAVDMELLDELLQEFPPNNWWGKYALKLYGESK